jgi:hypothetical protein
VQREVELEAGAVGWLSAQQHHGENIGDTATHVLFVEQKERDSSRNSSSVDDGSTSRLGPQ